MRAGVTGSFESTLELALLARPSLIPAAARSLVDSHFPPSVAADVLTAVGFDPEAAMLPDPATPIGRRRDASWRLTVLEAWDRQCAFCGFDGQAGGVPVGLEAAHVRWFALDGPDTLDNGLALWMLHHKLFDRGMLGLNDDLAVVVSRRFSARTQQGRAVYELHGHRLTPRPGTPLPAEEHVRGHTEQVFHGQSLRAD